MTLRLPSTVAALRIIPAVLPILFLAGCSFGYYLQAASGQLDVNGRSEPVGKLLASTDLNVALRARLELSQTALEFAHTELGLPDNGSYRRYADLERPYIVWNVFAAPDLALEPRRWCFPIAGCVSYRGYFAEADARAYAQKLAAQGYDVFVGGVPAYSTLGRLRDPLLNTMLPMSEEAFVSLLFHELAHQLLYIQDDSAFNEAFASVVEQAGLRRWLAAQGQVGVAAPSSTLELQVRKLLLDYRGQLETIYANGQSDADMRARKHALLSELTERYAELTRAYSGQPPYSPLFVDGINNAGLIALATYADRVPAFAALLQQCEQDFACFYEQAKLIGDLDPAARASALDALAL